MDLLDILLIETLLLVFMFLPAIFLQRLLNFSIIKSAVVFLSGITILYSIIALLFNYDMLVFLIVYILIVIIIIPLSFKYGRKVKSRKYSYIEKLLFVLFYVIFLAFPVIINLPMGVDSQGFGYFSLTVQKSGSIKTLDPFFPDANWVYSPAVPLYNAFFSDVSGIPLHIVMPIIFGLLSVVLLIYAYDFGKRFKSRLFGRILSICMLSGTWLLSAYVDSHYSTIIATLFVLLFIDSFFRYMKESMTKDFVLSIVSLSAIVYCHPDTIFNLLIGFVPFYITIFFSKSKISIKKYLNMFLFIPLMAVVLFMPYLIYAISVLAKNSFSHAGFYTKIAHIKLLIGHGGLLIPVLAIIGLVFALKRRRAFDVFLITWFIAIIEFSSIGVFEWIFSFLPFSPLSMLYPGGVAWHAPIVPLSILSAFPIYYFIRMFKKKNFVLYGHISKKIPIILIIGILIFPVGMIFGEQLIVASKELPMPLFGEFSSEADVEAMLWLKANTPEDSFILNYPRIPIRTNNQSFKRFEGHWVPIISERHTVYFRDQTFFFGNKEWIPRAAELYDAYYDPVNNKDVLEKHGVDYVIVPEILSNPESIAKMHRWKYKEEYLFKQKSVFDDAGYLQLVFESNGAKVYKISYENE